MLVTTCRSLDPSPFNVTSGSGPSDELRDRPAHPRSRGSECQRAAANLTARIERVAVFGASVSQRGQRHLLGDVDATPLVERAKRQQVLHPVRHAGARILDMRDRLIGASQRTPAGHAASCIAPHTPWIARERRAKLMAGIGDESFHLRRGLLLLVEALLYSGEHGVERDRQRTDLRVLAPGARVV